MLQVTMREAHTDMTMRKTEGHSNKKPYRFFKRVLDLLVSLAVVILGFIPGLILSIFIFFDTKGSPIYSQIRVGKNGKPFRIYKFRTMVKDSDNVEKYFTPEQLAIWKKERKVRNDPRITKLGRVLRELSLDELPQFINVLFGQISIVGPRVITFDELEHFGKYKNALLSVPPGITGEWQTGPRNTATFENGLRQETELLYVKHASLKEDIKIFFRTFASVFKRTGK